MSRTRPLSLLVAVLVGAVALYGMNILLAMRGVAVLVPPVSLAVALFLIGVMLVALAWPVRKAATGERPIDPFFATRVVVLAKASALAGALLAGAAAGILIYLLSRLVVPLGSSLTAGATLVAAVALVAAALVAEHWCSLPPDEQTDELTEESA